MAIPHIKYNSQSQGGSKLATALSNLESGYAMLSQQVAAMIQMKDDGTNLLTIHAVGIYGFDGATTPDAITNANAALAELESLKAALDGISATLNQAFAKFRN